MFGGGDFRNEIIWAYESGGRPKTDFGRKHDVILRYTKSNSWQFNAEAILLPRETTRHNHMKRSVDADGRVFYSIKSAGKIYKYYADQGVIPSDVWTDFSHLQQKDPERLGYPTQKPESLLERIIKASSKEGDVILDAYCGCGTSIAVAQRLKRNWIGIDITYQSISLILKRLEDTFKEKVLDNIVLDGIPRDMESAIALANKEDDRVRKEFEKWAILTYSNNRAAINTKKGADQGIDGIAYFFASIDKPEKIVFQAKSGKVGRGDIATLNNDRQREGAQVGVLITLKEPTRDMIKEARIIGQYYHEQFQKKFDRIQIITVQELIEQDKRIEIPINFKMVKSAETAEDDEMQIGMDLS